MESIDHECVLSSHALMLLDLYTEEKVLANILHADQVEQQFQSESKDLIEDMAAEFSNIYGANASTVVEALEAELSDTAYDVEGLFAKQQQITGGIYGDL